MVKMKCWICQREFEIKYFLEPTKNEEILEMDLVIRCPDCRQPNRFIIQPNAVLKQEAQKQKPEKPNYIG